jgi:integrase
MTKTPHATPRYFQFWKGSWRIRVQVPIPLIAAVGKRELVKSLGTANLAKAEKEERALGIIHKFEMMIAAAKKPPTSFEPPMFDFKPGVVGFGGVVHTTTEAAIYHIASSAVTRKPSKDGLTNGPITFETIIAKWIKDRKPGLKAQQNMRRVVRYLCECAEKTDPTAFTSADLGAYKDWMVDEDFEDGSIIQHRGQLMTLWRFGGGNCGLTDNPVTGFQYLAKDDGSGRRGFTPDEARLILTAAREETDPFLRWTPWIMAFGGARIGEIVGSAASAVIQLPTASGEMVWCLDLQDGRGPRSSTRMPEERLKNSGSNRSVPLAHVGLIDEGFVDYVQGLSKGSALFPNIKPSPSDGKRSHYAVKKMGKWIRKDLELTEERIGPDHSWRHYFKTACRDAEIDRDVHDAITGHIDGKASSEYGEFPLSPKHKAVNKIRNPLAPDSSVRDASAQRVEIPPSAEAAE